MLSSGEGRWTEVLEQHFGTSVVGIVWVRGAQVLPEGRFASTVRRESHPVEVPVSWELVWDETTGYREDGFGSCTR